MYDIIIIGSGPAGLTAAIYASRAQLTAVVLEKDYLGSGQIAVSEQVDNYPGLPGIDGYTLGEKFREHAEQLGAKFENVEVDHIERTAEGFTVFCKEGEPLQSRTILCASGTSYRRLDVPGGTLQGVSYCATCDGAFYKDKTVAVIGGGDTALGDAMYLSRMAKKVYLVHRRQEFRANQALQTAVQHMTAAEPDYAENAGVHRDLHDGRCDDEELLRTLLRIFQRRSAFAETHGLIIAADKGFDHADGHKRLLRSGVHAVIFFQHRLKARKGQL